MAMQEQTTAVTQNDHESQENVRFRLLIDEPDLVPIVSRWWFDQWGYVNPSVTFEQQTEDIRSAMSRDEVPVHVVALRDDQPVGVAMLKDHEMQDRYPNKRYWLGNVYVAEEWRGQGIAAKLAMKIVEIARAKGIPALHLQTLAIDGGLYAKLGWTPLENVQHRGREVCVMVRSCE